MPSIRYSIDASGADRGAQQWSRATDRIIADARRAAQAIEQLDRVTRAIGQTAGGVGSSMQRILGPLQQLQRAPRAATTEVNALSASMRNMSSAAALSFGPLSGLGARFTAIGSLATRNSVALGGVIAAATGVGAALTLSVRAAADFESGMLRVAKVTNASTAELKAQSADILKLSSSLGIPATELAKIEESAARLGIRGSQNLATFAAEIAKLTRTTDLGAEGLSTQLAQFLNLTKTAPAEITKVSSAITALGNNFAAGEGKIISMALELARGASAFQVGSDKLLALSASLAAVGERSERSGTAMTQVLIGITQAAAGGKHLEDFARLLGVTNQKFKELAKQDVGQVFIDVLRRLQAEGPAAINVLQQLHLGSSRNFKVLLTQAQAIDEVSRALGIVRGQYANATATDQEFARMNDSVNRQLEIAGTNLENLGILLGSAFLPAINSSLQSLNELLGLLQGIAPATKQAGSGVNTLATEIVFLKDMTLVLVNALNAMSGVLLDAFDPFEHNPLAGFFTSLDEGFQRTKLSADGLRQSVVDLFANHEKLNRGEVVHLFSNAASDAEDARAVASAVGVLTNSLQNATRAPDALNAAMSNLSKGTDQARGAYNQYAAVIAKVLAAEDRSIAQKKALATQGAAAAEAQRIINALEKAGVPASEIDKVRGAIEAKAKALTGYSSAAKAAAKETKDAEKAFETFDKGVEAVFRALDKDIKLTGLDESQKAVVEFEEKIRDLGEVAVKSGADEVKIREAVNAAIERGIPLVQQIAATKASEFNAQTLQSLQRQVELRRIEIEQGAAAARTQEIINEAKDKGITLSDTEIEKYRALGKELDALKDKSTVIADAFEDFISGIAEGTQDLSLDGITDAFKAAFAGSVKEKLEFDKIFEGNMFDLGGSVLSNIGGAFQNVFSLASSLFGGGGGFVGPLLENGATGTTGGWLGALGGAGGGGLGVLANLALNSGGFFANSNPGVSLGLSGLSLLNSGLTAATGTGIVGTLFGSSASSATVGSILGETGSGVVGSLFGEAGASILGTSLETIGAVGGAAVGAAGGAYSAWQLGQGGQSASQIAASLVSIVAGAASVLNVFVGIGTVIYAIVVALAAIAGAITDLTPTAGTLRRRAAEAALDQTDTFNDLQKGNKEKDIPKLGDLTRYKFALNTNPNLPSQRDHIGSEGLTDLTAFSTLFAQSSFGGSYATGKDHVQGIAQQWTNILTEFFSRMEGSSEEVSAFIRQQMLSAFRDIGINDATKAFEVLNAAAANFKINTDTFDYFHEEIPGVTSLGTAIRGIGAIFEQELPPGVHVAALALESMTRDGQRAFANLDTVGHDTLVKLANDAENFDQLAAGLLSQGFEIDTEAFDRRLKDVTASAQFVGDNIGALFSGASVSDGMAAVGAKLKETVVGAFSEASLSNLFDTTNIAASFEPVFAVLRQLNEGAYKGGDGRLDAAAFNTDIVSAIAEGKASLADYLPQIIAYRDAMKEVGEAIDEALKPSTTEAFWTAMQDGLKANQEAVEQFAASLFDAAAQAEALLPGSGRDVARGQVQGSINDFALGATRAAAAESVAAGPEGQRLAALETEFQAKVKAAFEDGVSTAEIKDLTSLKQKMSDAGQALADKMADSAKVFDQLFAAERFKAKVEAIQGALDSAVGGAGKAFFDVLSKGGSAQEAAKALGESFRSSVQQSVVQGITDAVVQSAVIQGALAPLIAGLGEAIKATLPGGINEAEGQFLSNIVGKIGTETNAVLGQLEPLFTQLGIAVGGIFENTDKTVKNIDEIDRQTKSTDYGVEEMARRAAKSLEDVGDAVPPATVQGIANGMGALRDAIGTGESGGAGEIAKGVDALRGALGGPDGGGMVDAIDAAVGALNGPDGMASIVGQFAAQLGPAGAGGAADEMASKLRDTLQPATDEVAAALRTNFLDALGDAETAARTLAAALSGVGSIPGRANGGPVPAGTMAFVGERGPELILAHPGGGVSVMPIDGIPGYADGTGDLIGISPRNTGPFGHPRVPPPPAPPRQSASTDDSDLRVKLNIEAHLEEFFKTGDFATFSEQFEQSVNESVAKGIMSAILETGPLKTAMNKFNSVLSSEIEKAWADGSLSDEELANIRTKMAELGGPIKDIVKTLGPEVEALFADLGLGDSVGSDLRSALGSAFRDFASSGDLEGAKEAVRQAFNEATMNGIVDALLMEGPIADAIENASTGFSDAMREALADGVISEDEADRLKELGADLGANLEAAFAGLDPAITALFDGMRDRAAESMAQAGDLIGGSLKSLLNDPANLNFASFSEALRGDIYQSVAGGLIDAFIQSAVIQGALAPMLASIQLIFDQIGNKQLTIAEANGLIAEQVGLINGVLADPTFKATMDTLITSVSDIGQNLNAFPPAARDVANSATDVQSAVTDAQKDVCDGACALKEKTIDLGQTILDSSGRAGDVQDIVFEKVPKFAAGGLVTRPTIGLIGEAGPEMVIPLDMLRGFAAATGVDPSILKELEAARGAFDSIIAGKDSAVADAVAALSDAAQGALSAGTGSPLFDALDDLRADLSLPAARSGGEGSNDSELADAVAEMSEELRELRKDNQKLREALAEQPIIVNGEVKVGMNKVLDVLFEAKRTGKASGNDVFGGK